MRLLISLLVALVLFAGSVQAVWEINNTIVRSNGLGSQFNVTHPWILQNLTISDEYIYFQGLNSSNPLEDKNCSFTFNFTETNINYSGIEVPYMVNVSYGTTHLISNLTNDTYVEVRLGGLSCSALYRFQYESADGNHNKNLTYAQMTCDSETMVFNVTLEDGINVISTSFNTISNIEFRHEETSLLINDTNMTLEIIGDDVDYSRNYSTTTGNLSAAFPTPGEFTLRYFGGVYQERFHYLDLTANSTVNLTLYVNENTSVDHVTVTVLDQNSDDLEDATVRLYRYDFDTNSYLLVEEGKTNFEGETRLRLTLGTEFYKFLIYYDGELKKETSPAYIYETTLTIYVNTGETVGETFEYTEEISHSIEFQEATRQFKLTYNDDNSEISRMCLNVYHLAASGRTLTNQSCGTSYGAILYAGTVNASGRTYLGQAEILLDGDSLVITELHYSYPESEGYGQEIFGNNGLIILLLLTLTLAGLGAAFRASAAIILTPLPLLFLSILNVITFDTGIAIGLVVLGLIIGGIVEAKHG